MKYTNQQNSILSLVCLAILLVGIFQTVKAERLPVKTYSSADGLGSSFIDYLMRDSRGFMWFCTRDGLSRFDGSRFVNYQITDKNAAPGEKSPPPGIEGLYETRDGMFWITTAGGSFRFDPNEISQPDAKTPRLNAELVTGSRGRFFEDSKGNLWLTSGGLSRMIEKDGKFVLETTQLSLPVQSKTNLIVDDIDETADGSLWIDSNWGLVRRLPDNRTVFYPNEAVISIGNSSMKADASGKIWLSRENRILVINPEPLEAFNSNEQLIVRALEPTSIVQLKPDGEVPLPEKNGEIFQYINNDLNRFVEQSYAKRIFQTSDGDVWITAENNLLQFSKGTLHLHTSAEGLPNVMGRMAEDAAGNLWIGGHAGLARLDRQGLVTYGTVDGSNSSRFFSINEDQDGALYFAGRDFYLSRFDGKKFQTVRPAIEPNSIYLWTSRFARRASDGDWWFATNKKLYRFAAENEFSRLNGKAPFKTYTAADGLRTNAIFQIFEDSGGQIWVSTRNTGDPGNGVSRLKKGEEKFQTFSEADGLPKTKSFTSAAEDLAGNIWFSFYEGGLARFNGQKFDFWGAKDGLPYNSMPDLHLDQKGRLWAASALGGLYRIDEPTAEKFSFVNLTTADGLTSNNIRTITEDKFGRIYVGTARGVDRISPETGRVKHYSVNDGLAADFVVDSHCDKNGNLWFATNDGISRLTPLPEEKSFAPRILLGNLSIAGEQQVISQLGSTEIDKGELSASQNNLQIEFFGLDFRAGETLRYQYQLEGADTDWSQPSELRTVTFANLQPGSYRFLVRAINSEGAFSENPAVVSFKILSPIWLRWWFITLSVLALALFIFTFYRYRLARLKEVNVALEDAHKAEEGLRKSQEERLAELEKVRSRIATDLHDDIGASLTQIAILSEVAQAQSKGNGATDSLSKITNVSNELVGTMSDIVWSINPTKDHLSDLIQRMRRFASDSLSAKGITFQFVMPESNRQIIVNSNIRREMFLIFKESINNIVKHSEAKKVEIELKIENRDIILQIKDNGKGFEVDSEAIHSSIQLGGNGVLSMEKRAREMSGRLEIESEVGQGTNVKLSLPMEKNTAVGNET